MSAGSSLQNWGGLTVDQKLNSLRNALRGGPPVLDAQGAPSDGTTDFGSAANTIRRLYAENIRLGASDLDLRPLVDATPGYAFDASGDFDWPFGSISKALVWMVSAESGSGGGGAANAIANDSAAARAVGRGGGGGPGGASTAAFGGVTLTSGSAPGGDGGFAGLQAGTSALERADIIQQNLTDLVGGEFFRSSVGATRMGGMGGAGTDIRVGLRGGWSRQIAAYGVLTGLSLNDTITITVSQATGAAGTAGTQSGQNSGTAGEDGQADGLVIIWPIR